MTDQAQAAAETPAAPQAIPMSEGLARYRASKDAAKADTTNPISEAARTMGQRAAEARRERQAQASQTQEASQEEEQQDHVEDDPPAGETLDDTANAEPPAETEAEAESEPEETQTITLRDGTKVTLDEVADGFMMKADHTRKSQALASDRKEFESTRTQRLTDLDQSLGLIKHVLPQPKSLDVFVEEMGSEEGIKAFARQNTGLEKLAGVIRTMESEKAKGRLDAETARDSHLSENYNKEWADKSKRDKAYTELSGYALQLGATPDDLRSAPIPAYVIQALDKASKYDAMQANKGSVTKLIADKPRVSKPGSKVSAQASQQTNVQAGFSRLKSSGKLTDAVALLRTMRGPKRG